MAVKSILDVEVNDGSFRAFGLLYEKYQRALEKAPALWGKSNKQIDIARKGFEGIAHEAAIVRELTELTAQEMADANREMDKASGYWSRLSRTSGEVAGNVRAITGNLFKWGAISTAVTGLVGAGSLWGLDRLAGNVSASRRSALGLGIGYGSQRAFAANFSRLVDPESFLSGVAGAKLDVNQRVGLIGAGLTQGQINGDTGSTAVALLQNLKRIADTTNPALYASTISARRLGNFVSPEDLQRLRNTSPEEFSQLIRGYKGTQGAFDVPADVTRKWQDFTTQMTIAGQGIENTFVRGLAPIVPGLTKLSAGIENTIHSFLDSPALAKWLEQADKGIEKFADYIGTDEFQKNVETFVSGLGVLAEKVAGIVSWFGGGSGSPSSGRHGANVRDRAARAKWLRDEAAAGPPGARYSTMDYLNHIFGGSQTPINNPGNLRLPGQSTGFAHFASPEAGIGAMARQLGIYGKRDHLDTISGIISKYAPANENNTAAYIKDVSRRTGFDPNAHLDLSNPQVLSQIIAAMVTHEQKKGTFDKYKDAHVVVEVLNHTGGNVVSSVNGLKN